MSAIKAALDERASSPWPAYLELELRLGVRERRGFAPSLDAFVWSALFEALYRREHVLVSALERDQWQLFEGADDVRGARFDGARWQSKRAVKPPLEPALDASCWFDVRLSLSKEVPLAETPASIAEARAMRERMIAAASRARHCFDRGAAERAAARAADADERVASGAPSLIRARERRSLRLCSPSADDCRRHWRLDFRRVAESHRRRADNAYEYVHASEPRYELELEFAPLAGAERASTLALAYAAADVLESVRVALGADRDAMQRRLEADCRRFELEHTI